MSQAVFAAPEYVGCEGTVYIHQSPGEPSSLTKDDSKLCLFHLHGLDFDPGSVVNWSIATKPGGNVVLTGTATILSDGIFKTGQLSLPNG